MNISQVIRSLLGAAASVDAKSLELKVGQIVKGMVIQLLDGQDALVNIGGTHVVAKLELPLQQGQVTLLQVQPETAAGQVILKPLDMTNPNTAHESQTIMLKIAGMKDNPINRELLQVMHQEGIQLSKDNIMELQRITTNIPTNVRSEEWIEAGITAYQKGFPLTELTISSLHQAMFGPPAHVLLQQLEDQVKLLMNDDINEANPDEANPDEANTNEAHTNGIRIPALQGSAAESYTGKLMLKLIDLISEISARGVTLAFTEPIAPKPMMPAADGQPITASQSSELDPSMTVSPKIVVTPTTTLVQQTPATQEMLVGVANHESPEEDRTTTQPPHHMMPIQSVSIDDKKVIDNKTSNKSEIYHILKTLGLDHEHDILTKLDQPNQKTLHSLANSDDLLLSAGLSSKDLPSSSEIKTVLNESIKSLLIELSSTESAPATIRENAGQLLLNITGQQLLITPDRSSSMFAYITMFIPVKTVDGSQTASVHIQSRKGKKGEIDAGNCRLLFNLLMDYLGETIVDVQVLDRIVSLQVHNDHPAIGQLLEDNREDIASAIEQAGYKFISLKSTPFPSKSNGAANETPKTNSIGLNNTVSNRYKGKPYKGVDIRI